MSKDCVRGLGEEHRTLQDDEESSHAVHGEQVRLLLQEGVDDALQEALVYHRRLGDQGRDWTLKRVSYLAYLSDDSYDMVECSGVLDLFIERNVKKYKMMTDAYMSKI